MDNVYIMSDRMIQESIGSHLKELRLKQNISQLELGKEAGISLSSVKKIEKGEIGSFDSWIRVLRTLGKLDILIPLVEEALPSPNEYYEIMNALGKHKRKRASGGTNVKTKKEDSEW